MCVSCTKKVISSIYLRVQCLARLLGQLVEIWWSRQLDSNDSYQQKQGNRFLKGLQKIAIQGISDSYQGRIREPYKLSAEYQSARALLMACAAALCLASRLQK